MVPFFRGPVLIVKLGICQGMSQLRRKKLSSSDDEFLHTNSNNMNKEKIDNETSNMAHYQKLGDTNKRNANDNNNSTNVLTLFILKAIGLSSLGGIIFGYDLGIISGALPQLKESLSLTDKQQEMVVSFLYLGGVLGATIGGVICDTFGRKNGILLTDIIFIIGGLLLSWAKSLRVILLGRIVMGFGVSVSGIADVAYLHEISPPEWRGSIVSVNEACISLGFLFAYITSYFTSKAFPEEGWRLMFGISVIIATIQFIGMTMMPESPIWLKSKRRISEAIQASETIGLEIMELEMKSFHDSSSSTNNNKDTEKGTLTQHSPLTEQNFLVEDNPNDTTTLTNLTIEQNQVQAIIHKIKMTVSIYHRQIIITLFLSIAQQFCGQTNVLNFAPEIFSQVGISKGASSLAPMLYLGAIKFIVTCIVIWKIEDVGRSYLLRCGMSSILISLVLLCIAFSGHSVSGEKNFKEMPKFSMWLAVMGVFGVVIGYSISFGPLTWLFVSELFPADIRGRALGTLTISTFFAASLVSYTFLSVQKSLGPSVPFILYSIITAFSIWFAYNAIPDTSGKTSKEIAEELETMTWWKKFSNQNHEDIQIENSLPNIT